MKLILRIFVSDWRRKLTALGLAFALWLWVDSFIAEKQTRTLRIVATPSQSAVEIGTLQARVPSGWLMTEAPAAAAENQAKFNLVGSPAEIEAFLATGFSASFDPELDRLEDTQYFLPLEIRASELRWTRPDQAAEIIDFEENDVVLRFMFERIVTERVALDPRLVEIAGTAPDSHLILEDELSFSLTHTYLQGPARALTAIITQVNNRLEAMDSGVDPLPAPVYLFEPLVVSDTDRNDLFVNLRLAEGYQRSGLRLLNEDSALIARLPVRLSDPTPRSIVLEPDMMTVVPDPEGEWVAPDWVATKIRVVLSSQPAIGFDITEDWLFRHLLFLLPLDQIPASALDQDDYPLQVEWTLMGLEDEVKDEVLRRLSITFEDPSKRTVIVQRAQ